jgi:hypothetical protein
VRRLRRWMNYEVRALTFKKFTHRLAIANIKGQCRNRGTSLFSASVFASVDPPLPKNTSGMLLSSPITSQPSSPSSRTHSEPIQTTRACNQSVEFSRSADRHCNTIANCWMMRPYLRLHYRPLRPLIPENDHTKRWSAVVWEQIPRSDSR